MGNLSLRLGFPFALALVGLFCSLEFGILGRGKEA